MKDSLHAIVSAEKEVLKQIQEAESLAKQRILSAQTENERVHREAEEKARLGREVAIVSAEKEGLEKAKQKTLTASKKLSEFELSVKNKVKHAVAFVQEYVNR